MKKLIFILCMVFTLAFTSESFANTKTNLTKNETMELTKSKPDFVIPICWFSYSSTTTVGPDGTTTTTTVTLACTAIIF